MYVGHLRDACVSTEHIKKTLHACHSMGECTVFACTWSETEIRTQTWRAINRSAVLPSWKCLSDVMRVMEPYELNVDSQKKNQPLLWGRTKIDAHGVVYNLLAMQKCMKMINLHGSFDAVYRLRFEELHNRDTGSIFRAGALHNTIIRSQPRECFSSVYTYVSGPSVTIGHIRNIDNRFWGSQQRMTSLMEAWTRYIVHDTAKAMAKYPLHPENAMCTSAAVQNISMQMSCAKGPFARLRC